MEYNMFATNQISNSASNVALYYTQNLCFSRMSKKMGEAYIQNDLFM